MYSECVKVQRISTPSILDLLGSPSGVGLRVLPETDYRSLLNFQRSQPHKQADRDLTGCAPLERRVLPEVGAVGACGEHDRDRERSQADEAEEHVSPGDAVGQREDDADDHGDDGERVESE